MITHLVNTQSTSLFDAPGTEAFTSENSSSRSEELADLEEQTSFMRAEVVFENVPQPADYTMTVVKTAVVLCVPPTTPSDSTVMS